MEAVGIGSVPGEGTSCFFPAACRASLAVRETSILSCSVTEMGSQVLLG